MSPLLIPILALLIPIVAILAGTFSSIAKMKAESASQLGQATGHLEDELTEAKAERDRLRRRIETLEAIVTSEGYDLEREARAAGIGRIDAGLLDDLPGTGAPARPTQRVRE